MNKETCRRALGAQLRNFREKRGVKQYKAAEKGGIRFEQAQAIESGSKNYTIDTLMGYLIGIGLYASDAHDIGEFIRKAMDNHITVT